MHTSRRYCVTMKLFARPGAATAVATMLILSPANSFALPADQMAGNVAAAAVRFLASEEIHHAQQVDFTPDPAAESDPHQYRALFESEGWTVVRYSEEPIAAEPTDPAAQGAP